MFFHTYNALRHHLFTHQQNGSIERKHFHIVEIGLALLDASSLSLTFWVEAFTCVVYTRNMLPTSVLDNLSPYEKVFSIKPNYHFFQSFWVCMLPLLRSYNQHNFFLVKMTLLAFYENISRFIHSIL